MCAFVHTCVHGLYVFTHVHLHMCLCVWMWVHEFSYIHNMINCIVLLRTLTQEATYLSLNLTSATFWLCKFEQVFLISCFSVLILSSCNI